MNRAALLAYAATALSLVGGAIVLINANTAQVVPPPPGTFNRFNPETCTEAVCNAPACVSAQNVLDDAGISCIVGFAKCPVKLSPVSRAVAADAGVVFGASDYQHVRFIGMKCTLPDAGVTRSVPVDDNGWPLYAYAADAPACARAPLDGGNTCLRNDGSGPRFFGTGNVFPAAQASGTNCDAVECTVIFGDDPNITL
jgi:hypothetical protein